MQIIHDKLKEIDPDILAAVHNAGVMEGMKHSKPSPETLAEIETIKKTISEHIADHKATDAKVDTLLEFAKKTEPLVDAWSGAGALGSIVRSIGAFVVAVGSIWYAIQWIVRHA